MKQERVGQRLRRLRETAGLTQRDLAGPGISHAHISRIEAGERQPSLGALRQLAAKLGVSPTYLETGTDLPVAEELELRLSDLELQIRLGDAVDETSLEKIKHRAAELDEKRLAARAEAALGTLAHRRGDLAKAIVHLEQATENDGLTPVSEPDIFAALARAYAAAGEPEAAIELLRRCVAYLDAGRTEDPLLAIRYALFLSYALADAGHLDQASETLASALEQSAHIQDNYLQVRLYWSRARLLDKNGQTREALENIRRAAALLEATEDRRQLARAHILWAELLTRSNKPHDAEAHLELAETMLGGHAEAEDIQWLHTQRAHQAADTDRPTAAFQYAQDAIAQNRDDPVELASAHWALAKAHTLTNNLEAASQAFSTAADLYAQGRQWRQHLTVSRAWASALKQAGQTDSALEVLEQSNDLAQHHLQAKPFARTPDQDDARTHTPARRARSLKSDL